MISHSVLEWFYIACALLGSYSLTTFGVWIVWRHWLTNQKVTLTDVASAIFAYGLVVVVLWFTLIAAQKNMNTAPFHKEKSIRTPSFTISIPYFSRTSRHDYRTVIRGEKEFLEMRQTGKKKWIEVEDVTCTHPGENESESFDYKWICK